MILILSGIVLLGRISAELAIVNATDPVLCCNPAEQTIEDCREGCTCCPDGTWGGSIGDAQTFTCGGTQCNATTCGGTVCDTTTTTATPVEGYCPDATGLVGICVDTCASDTECAADGQLCCSNGCGHVCTDPWVPCNECEFGYVDECGNSCTCGEDGVMAACTLLPCEAADEQQPYCGTPTCSDCPYGFFDGCNACKCATDGTAACTEMACEETEDPYCIDIGCDICPFGYNDGCNACTCGEDGTVSACTIMFCEETSTPYCTAPTCDECPNGFFDGCNDCFCNDGGDAAGCTRMACEIKESPYCKESDEITCDNCQVYNDGCNTCRCSVDMAAGDAAGCTKMLCEEDEEPYCMECYAGQVLMHGVCVDIGCDSCTLYNDGCNDCFCGDYDGVTAGVAACTMMYCENYGDATCTECVPGYALDESGSECVRVVPNTTTTAAPSNSTKSTNPSGAKQCGILTGILAVIVSLSWM